VDPMIVRFIFIDLLLLLRGDGTCGHKKGTSKKYTKIRLGECEGNHFRQERTAGVRVEMLHYLCSVLP
jgi:hypothetical protein